MAQTATGRLAVTEQQQALPQNFEVWKGIDLEETLRRYNQARVEVLAQAETKAARDGDGGESKDGVNKESGREATALQTAWRKLKKDLGKA